MARRIPEPVFGLRGGSCCGADRRSSRSGISGSGWMTRAAARSTASPGRWRTGCRRSACPLDLAVELNWNFFNDRKLLQLELIDWRSAT